MQAAKYRRYKIEGITGGDDYAAMRQVLTRRYSKVVEAQREEGGIDFAAAGKPMAQRHSARGCAPCPTWCSSTVAKGQVGVARECSPPWAWTWPASWRGEGRGPQGGKNWCLPMGAKDLGKDSAALMLVAQIRDEAHRFAITGMRCARQGAGGGQLKKSPALALVQKRARRPLLQRFGGAAVAAASVEDIATVEGISRELAEEIYRALR